MNRVLVTSGLIATVLTEYGIIPKFFGSLDLAASRPAPLAKSTIETISFCRENDFITLTTVSEFRGIVLLNELSDEVSKCVEQRQDVLLVECRYSEAMFYKLCSIWSTSHHFDARSHLKDVMPSRGSHQNIGAFSHVEDDVHIDPTATVGPNCSIRRSIIGENSVLQAGVRLGDDALGAVIGPGGVWYDRPHFGGVIVGSNVRIENNTVIQAGFMEPTQIRNNCRIGPNTSIGSGVKIGEGSLIAKSVTISGSVVVGKECRIWGGVAIREGVHIGDGAIIGMGAVILNDVPSGETWFGNPARRKY